MGWQFPYVSTYESDFAFDFGLAVTEEQAQESPELKRLIDDPPDSLRQWAHEIGAELKDGLRENPELDRVHARGRRRLPHLHRVGTRPVCRSLLQFHARANAEGWAAGVTDSPQGRVPNYPMNASPREQFGCAANAVAVDLGWVAAESSTGEGRHRVRSPRQGWPELVAPSPTIKPEPNTAPNTTIIAATTRRVRFQSKPQTPPISPTLRFVRGECNSARAPSPPPREQRREVV